jgi:aminoglycoside phosphotransferase (APT) family kinase protein
VNPIYAAAMGEGSNAGINEANISNWLTSQTNVHGKITFEIVTHGRSNLTYVLEDENKTKWILRRPPTGHVLASAHDMSREHKIISALEESNVPVPGIIGMCNDEDVTGAPFFVMDFVQGNIIKDLADTEKFSPEERKAQSKSLVEVLASLHLVDPEDVGLGDLGKKEDYISRQLRRWKRQVDEGSDRSLPLFDDLHKRLEDHIPPQIGHGIVHGDYRLDNCMIGLDNKVAAVLDWELCTLGDVLADLGGMLMWWGEKESSKALMSDSPTLADGYISMEEAAAYYEKISGRDLSDLPYYIAFQFWRLAAITEGVRVRFTAGAMGDKDIGDEIAGFKIRIDGLLEASSMKLKQL